MSLNSKIAKLIKSGTTGNMPVRALLYTDFIQVYLRAGRFHLIPESHAFVTAVEIARVEVADGKQGTGLFKDMIKFVEKTAAENHYYCVRVGQVQNTELMEKLMKHGYSVMQPEDEGAPTLIKLMEPASADK